MSIGSYIKAQMENKDNNFSLSSIMGNEAMNQSGNDAVKD